MSERKKLEANDSCPGGLAQTVRECGCADLVPRINDIDKAWDGNQRRAALDQIDLLIKKEGLRACTATIKSNLLFELGEIDEAIATIQQLVEIAPEQPAPLAQLAGLLATRGDEQAVEVLLDAAEKYESQPAAISSLISATLRLGALMAEQGDFFGANAWLRVGIPYLDEESRQEVVHLMQGQPDSKNLAMFVSTDTRPLVTPQGAESPPAIPASEEALQASAMGRLRRAEELLKQAITEQPNRIDVWHELVTVLAGQGKRQAAHQTLRKMAELPELSSPWQLWIRSVAQWYGAAVAGPPVYRQHLRWEVDDANAVLEALHSHPQTLAMPDQAALMAQMSPPPKAMFGLLSKPALTADSQTTADEIPPEKVPYMLGLALLFGKQTDKPAMLEIMVDAEEADNVSTHIEEIAGDHLGNAIREDGRRQIPAALRSEVQWQVAGVPLNGVMDLVQRCDQYWVEELWPAMPHPGLDGKTPLEAKDDTALAKELAAAVLNIEVYFSTIGKRVDIDRVRERLGVPKIEITDPWEVPIEKMALPQWTRLDMVKLGHEEAAKLISNALSFRYVAVVRLMADHILDLLGADEPKYRAGILHRVAEAEYDPKEAARRMEEAAKALDAAGEDSFVAWYLTLEKTIASGDLTRLDELLPRAFETARTRAEYSNALMQLLMRYGLISPQQAAGQAGPAPAAPAQPGGVWTPDAPERPAPTPAAEPKQESKLWLPGMD